MRHSILLDSHVWRDPVHSVNLPARQALRTPTRKTVSPKSADIYGRRGVERGYSRETVAHCLDEHRITDIGRVPDTSASVARLRLAG